MRKRIQTTQGELTLEYEGGGVYRAPLHMSSKREYVVFHDRQQAMYKVIARNGKRASVIGSGDNLDAACEIIRTHVEMRDWLMAL